MGSITIFDCFDSANTKVDHHGRVAVRLCILTSGAVGQKFSFNLKVASAPCWHDPLMALLVKISRLCRGVRPEVIGVDSEWSEWIVDLISDLPLIHIRDNNSD